MSDVGDRRVLIGVGLDRLVAVGRHRYGTPEGPRTQRRTVVGVLAVGAEKSESVTGRDVSRVLEGGQVPPHPRRQDEGGGQHAEAEESELPAERRRARRQGGGDQEERDEEDQFGPHQGFSPAGRTEQDDAHHRGPPPEPHDGQQDEGHPEHRRCLRHQDPVGDPEVGIARRQERGGESDPRPGQGPA